jgi:uncharacterized membrane-anchored protein
MSDVPVKIEVNCATGIAVEVPLTAKEIEQRELDAIAAATAKAEADAIAQAEADAKASAQAKLAALGLTAEEIAALGK